MVHKIIFYGPPGAGKDTQGIRLAKRLGVPFISAGELIRREIAEGTEFGMYMAPYVQMGLVVPGGAITLMREAIVQKGLAQSGYVVSGFPRTVQTLQEYLAYDTPTKIFHLAVASDIILRRLQGRGRADDHEEAIARRLDHYERDEKRVYEFVRDQNKISCREIDASGTEDEVAAKIWSEFVG